MYIVHTYIHTCLHSVKMSEWEVNLLVCFLGSLVGELWNRVKIFMNEIHASSMNQALALFAYLASVCT